MIQLAQEISSNHDRGELDYLPTIREAIALADKGALDVKLSLPDGKNWRVEKIIKHFRLERYVRDWRPEFV